MSLATSNVIAIDRFPGLVQTALTIVPGDQVYDRTSILVNRKMERHEGMRGHASGVQSRLNDT